MDDLIDFEDGEDRRVNYEHKGTAYVLQSHDPYGFYTISLKRGTKTPHELSGHYTALSEAKTAITSYHNLKEFQAESKKAS